MIKCNKTKTAMVLTQKTKEGNEIEVEVSPYFCIEKTIKKIPENIDKEEALIYYTNGKRSGKFRIAVEDFYDINTVMKICLKNHLTMNTEYKSDIYYELNKQLNDVINKELFSYEHKCLGFQTIDNEINFLYGSTILSNGIQSDCIRKTGKMKNGELEVYNEMLCKTIFTNTNMSLAFVLGFLGVISTRLSQKKDLGVLLVNLSGRSTSGKSTMLKLIASIWGDTSDTSGTLILKNTASENGFVAQCSGLFSVPLLFDDLDTVNMDFSKFLYNMSKGTQKVVANVDGEQNLNRMGFSGICIFTGEDSILEHTNQRTGLYTRIMEFNEIKWTPDASTAEHIKSIVTDNYGFYGENFGKKIAQLSDEKLIELYNESYAIVKPMITKRDPYTDRTMKNIVLIHMTSELLKKEFNFPIDTKAICELAVKNEEIQMYNRNKPLQALNTIIDWYNANKNHFIINTIGREKILNTEEYYGYSSEKIDVLNLYIPSSMVKKVLTENGLYQLNNYKVIWKEKNWIKTEKDRYDCSASQICSGRHYHFIIKKENKT